jgi:hypothetical protein
MVAGAIGLIWSAIIWGGRRETVAGDTVVERRIVDRGI